jgi:hypothetical protein
MSSNDISWKYALCEIRDELEKIEPTENVLRLSQSIHNLLNRIGNQTEPQKELISKLEEMIFPPPPTFTDLFKQIKEVKAIADSYIGKPCIILDLRCGLYGLIKYMKIPVYKIKENGHVDAFCVEIDEGYEHLSRFRYLGVGLEIPCNELLIGIHILSRGINGTNVLRMDKKTWSNLYNKLLETRNSTINTI